MKKSIIGALALLLVVPLGVVLLAQQYNLSGTWEFVSQSPRGEMKSEMVITQEGNKLKVTMKSARGGESTGEGKIEDNKVEWTITRSTPRGEFSITYKGEIKDNNNMAGEAEMGQFGTISWTATRKS